jgi:hypothetical protein
MLTGPHAVYRPTQTHTIVPRHEACTCHFGDSRRRKGVRRGRQHGRQNVPCELADVVAWVASGQGRRAGWSDHAPHTHQARPSSPPCTRCCATGRLPRSHPRHTFTPFTLAPKQPTEAPHAPPRLEGPISRPPARTGREVAAHGERPAGARGVEGARHGARAQPHHLQPTAHAPPMPPAGDERSHPCHTSHAACHARFRHACARPCRALTCIRSCRGSWRARSLACVKWPTAAKLPGKDSP